MSQTSLTREEAIARYNGAYGYTGWNQQAADADFAATKGAGKGAGSTDTGGGGSSGTDVNELAKLIAQLAGSPTVLPELKVKSFEEYETEALEELRPYYERILKEEGGDVEKAKLRLEEDYKRGIRINREDYEKAKGNYGPPMYQGETAQQYYNRTKGMYGTNPDEGIALLENLAKRGILQSGIAKVDSSKLATAQQRRQEAIDAALKRYEEESGIKRERSLEDIGTEWERRQFALGEEKKESAATMGRQARSDEIATQEIERANIMRKAIQNIYG